MQESSSSLNPLQLFQALVRQLEADSSLSSERDQAWAEFFVNDSHPGSILRFLEWFLLERESETLGAIPIVAWAPEDIPKESPWHSLQESLFGFFKVLNKADQGFTECQDLWTGSGITAQLPHSPEFQTPGSVLLGRLYHSKEGPFSPLPSLLSLSHSEATLALAKDLAAQRSHAPRAVLSQLECEKLLSNFEGVKVNQNPIAALQELIKGEPNWSWDRIAKILEEDGSEALLDLLAFETDLDVRLIRSLLVAMELNEGSSTYSKSADSANLDTPALEEALKHFDEERESGASLEQLFDKLGQDLGLDLSDKTTDNQALGPTAPSGLLHWVNSYIWELNAVSPGTSPNQAFLETFAAWTEEQLEKPLDAQELLPATVLAFLCAESIEESLPSRLKNLLPFLDWCAEEQGAPLEEFLKDIRGQLGERLQAIQELNSQLQGTLSTTTTQISNLNPPQVQDDSKVPAPIVGWLKDYAPYLTVGDWVLGKWIEGEFHLAKVIPKEVLPMSSDAEAQN